MLLRNNDQTYISIKSMSYKSTENVNLKYFQIAKQWLCRNRHATFSTVGRCNHRVHRVHGDE